MLQITVLGCGSSLGMPIINCDCNICTSTSSYNKRTRSSIYIDDGNSQILVDFGFDIKNQLMREKIKKLDAAILTHYHADHVNGIDDLRIFPFFQKTPLEIFSDSSTALKTENRHQHLFAPDKLIARPVDFFAKFKINTIDVQFFRQHHGSIDSLGIRMDDFVYSSDVLAFPAESKPFLKNINVWILDCMAYESNDCHAGLDKILQWNDEYKPQQILLTNMNHFIDYHEISKILPSNIKPLYDGYKFIV
ncbi:MBL fold metallo-hydrolase [Candidatus Tisiphia endosymbiont of Melanophora roralis]|uniref:MBL fold metallo-hydrolase n=1 Tax=Candidatus Tisiphia endosymbiont of Melanophora roralis TaxID=3066261 RepID=UPI001E70DB02|nr:MAG: MBL fold metallo-hydrolase [Rickettsia endosymbiont of Cimex lectularius]